MKRLILVLVIVSLINGCQNTANPQISEDFTIDAQIIGRVSIGTDGPTDQMIVQIMVTNTTKQPKSFWILKCSWEDSFRTDRDDIYLWGRECIGNFPINITLNPLKNIIFTSTLKLTSDSIINRPIHFRIGLDQSRVESLGTNRIPNDKKIYWSKPIELGYFSINGYKKDQDTIK